MLVVNAPLYEPHLSESEGKKQRAHTVNTRLDLANDWNTRYLPSQRKTRQRAIMDLTDTLVCLG